MTVSKTTVVFHPTRSKTGIGVYQDGEMVRTYAGCCNVRILWDYEVNNWVCGYCSHVFKSNGIAGLKNWWKLNPEIMYADYNTVRRWLASWTGIPFDEIEVTVRFS